MRAFDASWRVVAGAGLLLTIAVTGCSAASPATVGGGQPSSPAAPGTTTPAGQTSEPTASAGVSPTASTGIQNLPVTSAVRSEFTAAYATIRQIPTSDVSGTQPNSVYYAYDPATNSYWGKATFVPTKTDPQSVLVGFQDTASTGLFSKVGSGSWQVTVGNEACLVLRFFPRAVLTAWALPTSPPAEESC